VAALLAAAGCSSEILAGEFPSPPDASLSSGCDACGALCEGCPETDPQCTERLIGACSVVGACVVRPPVTCKFTAPKHPDSECLGLRCGDPCVPGCVADGGPCDADARAPLRCGRDGVCSAATPSCGP
jgi:hypothetical protein